jgi:hypothetical protein
MFQIGLRPFRGFHRANTNILFLFYGAIQNVNTGMCRLTTGIRSEKCVVRRFRRCANVIECTYTNLDSTV